jgi:isocitrate lyase
VRQLAEEKHKLEEAAQIKAGEVDKVLAARLKAELDKVHAPVVAERDALHGRLTAIQIDQAVVNEATKRGLRATAIPDVTSRARTAFKLVSGVPQAYDVDGQTPRAGKDGVTPMTLAEWVDALVSDAPHLFEANAGGGAAGSGGGVTGNRSGKNPFAQASWNLTEQMKLQKSDPALAARLRAAA